MKLQTTQKLDWHKKTKELEENEADLKGEMKPMNQNDVIFLFNC